MLYLTHQARKGAAHMAKSWEELDSWTGEIEGDLWMEVNQPWFA